MTAPKYGFFTPPAMAEVPRGLPQLTVETDASATKPPEPEPMKSGMSSRDANDLRKKRDAMREAYRAARESGMSRAQAGKQAGYEWSPDSVSVCGEQLDRALGITSVSIEVKPSEPAGADMPPKRRGRPPKTATVEQPDVAPVERAPSPRATTDAQRLLADLEARRDALDLTIKTLREVYNL